MIGDEDLIRKAREVVNPKRLSPFVEAGGVGCALVTDKGNVYTGVCIDACCGMGFCAEHNAIGTMVTSGESCIVSIVAVDRDGAVLSPCGRCREFIYQMDQRNAGTRVLLKNGKVVSLNDLLPEHWKDEYPA
jgi:cytidine deaminase